MKWVPSVLVLLLVTVFGCASSDGGPVGTGITSSISGNVVQVDTSSGSGASLTVAVRVSIDEVPGLEATTDTDGNFELSGDFAGSITLRFRAAQVTATQSFDVPAGSTIVLENIEIRPNLVATGAIRQLGFFGQVAVVDCGSTDVPGVILVDDRRPMAHQFMVRLSADTVFVRGDSQPIQCADIHVGNLVAIEGGIRIADRTIDAITVTLAPPRPGQPPPVRELRFRGTVLIVNCSAGMMLIDDLAGRSRLRLSPATAILRGDLQPMPCGDIRVGDRVEGRGLITVRRPGVVDVITMIVRRPV